jgi:hypothetical protein
MLSRCRGCGGKLLLGGLGVIGRALQLLLKCSLLGICLLFALDSSFELALSCLELFVFGFKLGDLLG